MERRAEVRIPAERAVEITVLGKMGFARTALAVEFSGRGMRLLLDRPVAPGAAVKVQGDDWLALGEVCYCRLEGGKYAVGLELDQALSGLHELAELHRSLMPENPSPAREFPAVLELAPVVKTHFS